MEKPEPRLDQPETFTKGDQDKAPSSVEQLIAAIQPLLPGGEKRGVLPPGAQIIINFHNQGGVFNTGTATGVVLNSCEVDLTIDRSPKDGVDLAITHDESADSWFDANPGLAERCLAIVIAFLPGASLIATLEARDRLVGLFGPKDPALGESGFGKSRSAQLRAVHAQVEGSTEDDAGQERVLFTSAERYNLIRRYIWKERVDVRLRLVQWADLQARAADAETALALGVGIGACAPFGFTGLFNSVIISWAQQPTASSLLAAGEALGVAVREAPWVKERVSKLLKDWTGADSSSERQAWAVQLCESSWGVAELEEAFSILHRAETLEPVLLFKRVQRAIDLYWAWASLVPNAAEHVVVRLAKGFNRWEDGDRHSIVSVLPMVHLAHAIQAEIGYLKAEHSIEPPLLVRLSFQEGKAFKAVAVWLERGLRNRFTRKIVQVALGQLQDQARTLRASADFANLVEAIYDAAPDDDARSRIRFIAECWRPSPPSDIYT